MNNPLTREANEVIKRTAKYLICCGFKPQDAHNIARAEYLAKLLKEA